MSETPWKNSRYHPSNIDRKYKIAAAILAVPIFILLSLIIFILYSASRDLKVAETIISNQNEVCIEGDFYFTQLYKVDTSFNSEHTFDGTYSAKSLCIKAEELLLEGKTYKIDISLRNLGFLSLTNHEISLLASNYPEILNIPTTLTARHREVLSFQLDKTDSFFNYYLVGNDAETECLKDQLLIRCELEKLNLLQSEVYQLSLERRFGSLQVEKFPIFRLTTLDSIVSTSSTVNEGQILNTLNPVLQFKVNKSLLNVGEIKLLSDEKEIDIEFIIKNDTIEMKLLDQLAQNSNYTITIDKLEAEDGTTLDKPFILNFKVGDGPQLTNDNLIDKGFPTSENIILTFSEDLLVSQELRQIIKINSNLTYTYTISGNQIIINPTNNFTPCQQILLSIGVGVTTNGGLKSTESYSESFRSQCARVSSIGTSVNGNPINAYTFGSGPEKIIYFGAMHGSEGNTKKMLDSWIAELEQNAETIPNEKSVIVIPVLNPDGLNALNRLNANQVDLNRNFDTDNWQKETYIFETTFPNGGGSAPFSEPESRAIRDFILVQDPYLVISYHSAGGYVVSSGTVDAEAWGAKYGELTGYTFIASDDESPFEYEITGSFEEWAGDNDINSLIVELHSGLYSEFTINKEAFWYMLRL